MPLKQWPENGAFLLAEVERLTASNENHAASRDYAEGDTITVLLPAPGLKTWRVPSAFLTGERAQLPPACPHKRTASNAFGRVCARCFEAV